MNRAAAVAEARALVEQGMSANQAAKKVGEKHGVSERTIRLWATKEGETLGVYRTDLAKRAVETQAAVNAYTREQLKADLLRVAGLALAAIPEAVEGKDAKRAQGFAVTTAILIDKLRLEGGEVTSRSEQWSGDEWVRQLRMLEAEVARADAAPARTP